jgi:PAS domain S-box-containing protein
MRLMADEARAMAREARQQSSEHFQVILDHIKDVVLTVDEDGSIRTFNPTGERVFGYGAAEVIGRRIDLLIPQIAQNETIPEALRRLAAYSGDTLTDLAARESWGVRKDGKMFPAEIAISHARLSRCEMFVVCLREVTERHEAERVAAAEHDVFEKLTANAPLSSLTDQSFLDFTLQNVGGTQIAPALCFEITGTAAVTNLTAAIHYMLELQARGCRFALDDFGSGISSFLYLKTLPFDFLKIGGQFISQIASDPVDRSMVEAICKVGKALGIATVAESVEAQVLRELEHSGVDFVQGYYTTRPRPLVELGS